MFNSLELMSAANIKRHMVNKELLLVVNGTSKWKMF